MMAAAPASGRREVHHRVPRCLLKAFDRAQEPGLEPKDLQAWFEWEEEAFRYGVDPDLSREELAKVIEGSTVELAGDEHRALHGAAGDFARWGRLGGIETLRRYGHPWFALLARRRWGKVGVEALAVYREELVAKAEAA
ncbi:hypothetical protein GBA65_02335 [Rubrobacter marinus]|uniref:Uncharacterized protein n=1 Tax=Rubrobacter marinus TaxID=2653852 RepID=A0A6G8PT62_9ACTN|nr:hypothetical protein [Rubrobacter marinus]QIN77534.1 hypothetical protein GBA65_02335 [Rubrobacter marinus]